MFTKMRFHWSRRLGLAVAACGAMLFLWAPSANAQMCCCCDSTGGAGTSTGTSSSRGTGSTSSASNTASLMQAVQTANQLGMLAEQESREQALQAVQAAHYEAAVNFEADRQIQLRLTARQTNAQKQRELRAARGQRKAGKSTPGPEVEIRTASR